MNHIITVVITALTLTIANASACKLKKDEVLKIGCTTECGFFNSWAAKRAASSLGHKVELIDLSKTNIANNNFELAGFDAILIPGGADIHPKYYTSKAPERLSRKVANLDYLIAYSDEGKTRDPFEYGLLSRYFEDEKYKALPILGICRGMQMLSVSQGIPLYADLKAQLGIENRRYVLDEIKITDKSSSIHKIMKEKSFSGFELHHQGIHLDFFNQNKNRWPHLKITALSNEDRIAEVLEFTNRPVLGVQFHPEYSLGSVPKKIFSWLLTKACEQKQ